MSLPSPTCLGLDRADDARTRRCLMATSLNCLPRCKQIGRRSPQKPDMQPDRGRLPAMEVTDADDGSSSRGLEARLRGRLRRARSNWQCP